MGRAKAGAEHIELFLNWSTVMRMDEPQHFTTDAARWQALAARDRAADGSFVYAVRTTGVYCKPSCASRAPRRENVRFFADGAAALAAGFRACKRCRPDDAASDPHAAAIAAACARLARAEGAVPLAQLAQAAGLSPHHFHRVFKRATGVTPAEYQRGLRLQRAGAALHGGARVTDAIYAAGYNAASRFYAQAREHLAMAPRVWRAGGAGETIHYAVRPCSLGQVLVGATARGVCSILFADTAAQAEAELRQRFPKAELRPAAGELAARIAQIVSYVDAPRGALELPLDVRGTSFQQRVWKELRAIPSGATATYTEVAQRIGARRAVRAVAKACADNPVAVAVPCHRVIRGDGSLAGYRWGLARKRELLAREAAIVPGTR
jgi:AraC family transcriptional regulator of adaptative response/methylated-DNA-[protein]-cysteine methyltransferase